MLPLILLMGVSLMPQSAADAVTLRDGKVALGQVVETTPRGGVVLVLRRAWAAQNLPTWAEAWARAEAPAAKAAAKVRKERLLAWKRERQKGGGGNDPIAAWIDREVAALPDGAAPAATPLMVARIQRGELRTVVRRPKADSKLLRQGWIAGFEGVEEMARDDLKQGLEGRGFAVGGTDAIPLDAMLPPQAESEPTWVARKAATEVARDPGLRLLRYQGLIMDEPEPGAGVPAGAAVGVGQQLKDLLGEGPAPDPLPTKLREIAAKGRVGVVLTTMDIEPDFSAVRVETSLWVRVAAEQWQAAARRSSTVRPDALGAEAGEDLAEDPQVKAAFGVVESLGLGQIPADLKRRSLNMGAATREALGRARTDLRKDMDTLALSLERAAPMPKAATPAGLLAP